MPGNCWGPRNVQHDVSMVSARSLVFCVALAGAASATASSGVAATSCVGIEPSVEELVGGKVAIWTDLSGSGTFLWDRYDFAITGTVVSVETNDVPDSPGYLVTRVLFDVLHGYEVDSVPAELVVHEPDHGSMAGYYFVVGTTYFVPLAEHGPQGEANYSFVCDPILELTLDQATALPSFTAAGVNVVSPSAGFPLTLTSSSAPTPASPVPTTALSTTLTAGSDQPPESASTAPLAMAVPDEEGRSGDTSVSTETTAAIALVALAIIVTGAILLLSRRRHPAVTLADG